MSVTWERRLQGALALAVVMVVIWAHFSLYAAVSMCCAFLLGVRVGRLT